MLRNVPFLHIDCPPEAVHMNSLRLHQVPCSTDSVILLRNCEPHSSADLQDLGQLEFTTYEYVNLHKDRPLLCGSCYQGR